MRKQSLILFSFIAILICILRDLIGAMVFWISPGLSFGVMRGFDFYYFYYFVYSLRLFYFSKAFTRAQKWALTLTLGLFIVSFARTGEVAILLRSFRETVCPIAFLIAGNLIISGNPQILLVQNRPIRILVFTLFVSIAVGVKQMLTVHELSDYWFYGYMSKNNIEIADAFNFIRHGFARGTGLGFSPFSLGYFGLGLGILGLVMLHVRERLDHPYGHRIWPILAITGGLVAGILSDSRLATVSLGGLVLLWWSKLSPKFIALISIIIIYLFGLTFVEYLQDPSFNARFVQWGISIEGGAFANLFGSSLASGPREVWADSFILNFINNFGILALIGYFFFVFSFARHYLRRVSVFALFSLIAIHAIVQALEYNVFLPLAYLSVGLIYGINRETPFQTSSRDVSI